VTTERKEKSKKKKTSLEKSLEIAFQKMEENSNKEFERLVDF
jgi:hypothetical protein